MCSGLAGHKNVQWDKKKQQTFPQSRSSSRSAKELLIDFLADRWTNWLFGSNSSSSHRRVRGGCRFPLTACQSPWPLLSKGYTNKAGMFFRQPHLNLLLCPRCVAAHRDPCWDSLLKYKHELKPKNMRDLAVTTNYHVFWGFFLLAIVVFSLAKPQTALIQY